MISLASSSSSSTSSAPSPPPSLCYHCKGPIFDSAFLRVASYKFHKDHFLCHECCCDLHSQKFHQRDGHFYCPIDYARLFCHDCRSCHEKIAGGKMVSAFGFYYHPHCFVCHECQQPFEHGKYYERHQHPYCELHYPADVLCAACHKPVAAEESVKANALIYHATCLSCYHCGCDPALAGSTYVKEGRMYCRVDYHDLFSHRCTGCGEHITKQCITVNEEYYHPACLHCDDEKCQKALDKYICVNGHLRCSEHADSSTQPFTCDACHEKIDEEVLDPVRCVGKKLHPVCFICSRCHQAGQKKNMTLRDGLLCCMPCLLREGKHFDIIASTSVTDTAIPPASPNINIPTSVTSSIYSGSRLTVDTTKNTNVASDREASDDSGRIETIGVGGMDHTPNSGRSRGLTTSKMPPINQKIDWKKGELIGKGSFGKVYMGMNIGTGELIAVKQVRLNTTEELEQATAIQNEIRLMENLRHPNIVAFLGTQRHGNKLNILMEFVPGKSLDFLLDKFGALYEQVIRSYTKQLLLALDYCHSNGVVHRDIKGKNCLIDTKGNLKLADFGSAKKFVDVLSKDAPSLSYNYTPLWTAPEVLTGDYNAKVDIWSLGCVIIEMATAKPPWSEQNFENPFRALYHIGNSDCIPAVPKTLSEQGREFVRLCLTRDPDQRPTAAAMLDHPWIAELEVTGDAANDGGECGSSEDDNDVD